MGKRKCDRCRDCRLPLKYKGVTKMNQIHYTPVHPGEVLKDELEEVGLTQSALAKHLGVLPKTINEICRGRRGISAEMALKLSKALGGSPQFWLNLQNNWEISQLDKNAFGNIKL